jgi:hypothetical protein
VREYLHFCEILQKILSCLQSSAERAPFWDLNWKAVRSGEGESLWEICFFLKILKLNWMEFIIKFNLSDQEAQK